jgi:hypothetical protein
MSYNKFRAPTKNKFQKRWYFDAQVPKAIPFVGGSSLRMGSGNLTKRSITTMIRNSGENKQKIVAAQNTTNMTHNTLYTFNPFGNIPIVNGVNGRSGAAVYIKSWKMDLLFTNISTAFPSGDTHFRVMVVNMDSQYQSGSDTLASGAGSSDIFVQGSSYLINAHVDNNRCSVLYDKLVTLSPNFGTNQVQKQLTLDLCKGKTCKYLSPTSNYLLGKNTYLIIIPYNCLGVGGTSVLGSIQAESLLDFTDL